MQIDLRIQDFPVVYPAQSDPFLAPAPGSVRISCQQNGVACQPLVKVGDEVFKGQKIAEGLHGESVVHSSVCGRVKEITSFQNYEGVPTLTIMIENDGRNEAETLPESAILNELRPYELYERIRNAGLVTSYYDGHTRILPFPEPGAAIDTILLNTCPVEPFNYDNQLMMDHYDEFTHALKIMTAIYESAEIVVIEPENQTETISFLQAALERLPKFRLVSSRLRPYEQNVRFVIDRLLGRKLEAGQPPTTVGVLTISPTQLLTLAQAFLKGEPYTEQLVTVMGKAVKKPGNYRVALGTSIGNLLSAAGADTDELAKVVVGCPLQGTAVSRLDLPVDKCVTSIIAFGFQDVYHYQNRPCIRCGRCLQVCPVGILPQKIATYSSANRWDLAKNEGALKCIDCGQCAFVCPAGRPLLQLIEMAKREIRNLEVN